MTGFKQPVSVLVVIYTPALDVLLLERSAHPGFWQSVTGSREGEEGLADTARREVTEFNYRIADSDTAHVFVGLQVHGREEARRIAQGFEDAGLPALDIEVIEGRSIGRVRGSKQQTYTAGVVCAKVARYAL